ncbi:MAG TPA: 5-oxoprolinase subunit PxpB [Burkholderiaceae bacterium]
MTPRIEPSGDQCLIVEFGTTIDIETNRRACAFARRLEAAALQGVLDVVPSFTAVGVHYRATAVERQPGETPFVALRRSVEALLAEPLQGDDGDTRLVEIPVCYGGEFGPDLDEVAAATGLAAAEVVRLHGETIGRVFMLGFAPGHPFIGLWDERLAVPRRQTPRTKVPAGSVAIANRQSNVYPFDLPGGWNLIGRTPLAMFDPQREAPALLRAGDQVRFVPITRAEFEAMEAAAR